MCELALEDHCKLHEQLGTTVLRCLFSIADTDGSLPSDCFLLSPYQGDMR